jgi:hypothetical protein
MDFELAFINPTGTLLENLGLVLLAGNKSL